jgi:hypothetical protein
VDKYFQFLSDIVAGDYNTGLLLRYLHKIEFYSLIPNDDNRGEDGKRLREIFLDNSGESFHLPEEPCTVLEMFIGLAYRMENELKCGPHWLSVSECFWLFLKNLNLGWSDNDNDAAVKEVISSFLERKYKRNGNGGIFPLKQTHNNQKKVEIWYQMQEYLLENYF